VAIAALLSAETKPVFLLGAGASVKSGIPLAGALVERIVRYAYCKAHNRKIHDPTLMRSDWLPWLESQQWYRRDVPQADLYPLAVEYLLQPQRNRKEFFQEILRPDVPPSEGYQRLASLMARRLVRLFLTTNFDDLIVRATNSTPSNHHIEEIKTSSDYSLISTNPRSPQVVYIHGSVQHYTDRNIIQETQSLDQPLAMTLAPLLREHPLVIIAYRGAEP
jgi:NAD-dependent SIR2 family protein deacetylase